MIIPVSKYKLVKRYARFSHILVYLSEDKLKEIRYGYKVYQKLFKRYRIRNNTLRIDVKKPRVMVKRKTKYGKALEIKQKLSFALGGVSAKKFHHYVSMSKTKVRSPLRKMLDFIESRLDMVIYRINLVHAPRYRKKLIKWGFVYVNKQLDDEPREGVEYEPDPNADPVKNPSFKLKAQSYVDLYIPWYIKQKVEKEFELILKKRIMFQPTTEFLEISYKTLRAIMYKSPNEDNTFYAFDFKPYYFFRLYPV